MATDTTTDDATTGITDRRSHYYAVVRDSLADVRDQLGLHVLLVVTLGILGSPILLAGVLSTQSASQVLDFASIGFGNQAVENYRTVLTEYGFAQYMATTAIVAVATAVGKVAISLLAGLAIVYYDVRYKRGLFFLILLTLMLPVPVRIVPLYELMIQLGWQNTLVALVVPALASPTALLVLRQRFRSIPTSLVENARLDGVGPIRFLFRVLLPMSRGTIVGLLGIAFIWGWNQYLWPLIVISSEDKQVVQVGLAQLQGSVAAGRPVWGLIMAGTVLALLPPLVVMLALHRPLLETFNYQTE
jgi:sn-glycerol 3-phosphate transport system permease protein